MIKFLKAIILTILSISAIGAMGQDTTKTKKIREYILTPANLSPLDVSIKYKRQLRNRTFFKIGLVNLSAHSSTHISNISTIYPEYSYNFSAGLESGLEFRKIITDKFTFFHGLNLSFTYGANTRETEDFVLPTNQRQIIYKNTKVGLPYTLGLLFQLSKHFLFSAEINPGLFFTNNTTSYKQNPQYNSVNVSTNFVFANKNGVLSVAYRL